MDTDKLLKAIRILIKEEIKQTLPLIVKEVVKKEIKLVENKLIKETRSNEQSYQSTEDPFDKAERLIMEDLGEDTNDIQFTKNSKLNQVLNETAQGRTLTFTSKDVGRFGGHTPSQFNRQDLLQKMGYGDMSGVSSPPTSTTLSGTPVDLNDPSLSSVKSALTRDYSELVSKFKK